MLWIYSFTICQCINMIHVTERWRPFSDYVSLHSLGRPWSRWSTQSGGVPSSSYESYSAVKRKVYTCTLQVFSIHEFYFIHRQYIFIINSKDFQTSKDVIFPYLILWLLIVFLIINTPSSNKLEIKELKSSCLFRRV